MQQPTNIPELIVAQAQRGDADSRKLLYKEYNKAMYNICIRMTGNEADAADVLQEAFIHAFERLPQLKQPKAFAGWLKQIVVHQCIHFSKRQVMWKDLEAIDAEKIAEVEEEWWSAVSLKVLHQQIKALPNGCRQVFVLFAMEDLPHKEIAATLGISESTSKSQYQRARKLLKERIVKAVAQHG